MSYIKKEAYKYSLLYSNTIFKTSEINDKEPIIKLISEYSEVYDIPKHQGTDTMKFLYFNKGNIHKILYDSDETITINSDIIRNNLSDYFYLLLLLEDNPDIINYKYSLDFIEGISNQLKNENKYSLKKIIISKLILELINNYKQTDEYIEDRDDPKLKTIEEYNINNIKCNLIKKREINSILNNNAIKKNKIDKIYSDIINMLIKTNKINNYEYTYDIMEELDLKNIDITKYMFAELSKVLNENKDYMNNYIINSNSFLFKDELINFYYILFKYILKNTIYIYHNNFLLKARENFIKYSKNVISNDFNYNKKEMFKYIYLFITDSEFYYNKYIIKIKKSISNNSQFSSSFRTNSTNQESIKSKNLNLSSYHNQYSSNENENYYKIINFEKIVEKHEKTINSAEFIKEMRNGIIITGGPKDKFYIYNKNFEYIKDIYFTISSEEIEFHQTSNSEKQRRKISKNTQNIIETNISIKDKKKNDIQIIDCSKYAIMQYSININYNDNSVQINDIAQINISCAGCFEIKNISGNNEYVVYGENGIYHFDIPLFSLEMDIKNTLSNYRKDKRNFKSGIKINENYIALTSNSVTPKGEDLFAIYDTYNKNIIFEIKNSFINGINGLSFFEIENKNDNKKILLCACKKYNNNQKNGIFVIDMDTKEIKKLSYEFKETNDFEVNCFCQLYKKENNKFIQTNYFFVGGYENDKRKGTIKLYKINYKNGNHLNIIFLQDIFIDYTEYFEGLNGTINCIIQSKHNGKILVSCMDGKICSFSEPNLDFYLEDNDDDDLLDY